MAQLLNNSSLLIAERQQNNYVNDVQLNLVLSDSGRRVFEIVNFAIISCTVGLFGIAANIVNIIIFYKQGFKNTINICFFGLAISDLCCLASLEWITICMNPLFPNTGVPWIPSEVMYLSGAWLHVCFGRITGYITVYITAERCLCIVIPLKVKQVVTPTTTAVALFLIYIVNLLTLVSEYATSYLGWKFVPELNKTLLSMTFRDSRKHVEGLVSILHSVIGMLSFVSVIILTSILVVKLRQSSKWRKVVATGKTTNADSMSRRDHKTVKMIVLIATFLIACYTPGAIVAMTTFVVGPEFNIKGRYVNLCMSTWSVACSFHSINSSVNIFLYYSMSSRYRQYFNEVFLKCNIGWKAERSTLKLDYA